MGESVRVAVGFAVGFAVLEGFDGFERLEGLFSAACGLDVESLSDVSM